MIVYKQVTGYKQSTIDLTISVGDTDAGFTVCGGLAETGVGSTGLITTGFCISGSDGYLFDTSGNFFGGYQPNTPFNLQIHLKTGDKWSYFHNGKIIANDLYLDENVEFLKFEKENASLSATIFGQPDQRFTLGFLTFSGDALLYTGELIAYP